MTHTIAIVDDHLLIAKALSAIVENFNHYEVLFEAEHGKALIEKFNQKKNIPDIVLLDISMPVMDGFETAQWLKEQHPDVLVLALSMQDDDQTLIKMIKAGARGYLHKNVHPAELEKALDALVQNKIYFPEWATKRVMHNMAMQDLPQQPLLKLNDREKEFLQYIGTELTYREIAAKMFCSPRTVEGYRDGLFEKLDLKTRVGLVMYAVKHGLLKP